jgi:hypothetical protein
MDAGRQRGRRHVKATRRFRQRAAIDGSHKAFQIFGIHRFSLTDEDHPDKKYFMV